MMCLGEQLALPSPCVRRLATNAKSPPPTAKSATYNPRRITDEEEAIIEETK